VNKNISTAKKRSIDVELSEMPKRTKILIADDSKDLRLFLEHILAAENYQVISACDGVQALELFHKEQPELVVLDIMMPHMDGIEAARQIRNSTITGYVPIIFVTQMSDDENLQRCMEVGGDDFILKPFKPIMLTAKVNSLLRFKSLYQEQLQQKEKLLAYQSLVDQEQEVAAALFENLLHADFLETTNLRYILSPAALFNGDILLTAKTPGNQFYCLLGDFTGHGLSASIGAGPTAEIFYGMTQKGFGAIEILNEINRKMHKLLPVNMFLAVTMVSLNPGSLTMNLTSCGLPDHYLLNRATNEFRIIKSNNLPLGITSSFELQTQQFEVTEDDFLYLFTDGIIEAENAQGEQFGFEGINSCLTQQKKSGFDLILEKLQLHSQNLEQQDDITLVELRCAVESTPWSKHVDAVKSISITPLPWKSSMEFHVTTLRHLNPVPVMVNSLMEIQGLQNHRESIFLIVSELFNNSLEHGILNLDSSIKKTSEGFIRFFELRKERLNILEEGRIKVSFDHKPIANGGRLIIRVQDSGEGFEHSKVFSLLNNNEENYGRGIKLVQKLCSEVEYKGEGNRVKAIFEWGI
jgi:two-component system, HptB-dependent secretion and biofilm response regulator